MIIWLITGLWIALGCAELAHIITLFTDGTLQTYTQLSCVFVLVGIFAYIGILYFLQKKRVSASEQENKKTITKVKDSLKETLLYIVVLAVLGMVSIAHFCVDYVPELSDGTYDIVLGNLQSGNIHEVHPFTGGIVENAMPLRRQIIGLPSFYSALVSILPASTYVVLCKIVPICLWCLSMLMYQAFATKLFEKSREKWLFLNAVALFYLVSKGGMGMPARQLFYAGFTGEAIRSALLIPYTLYVSWKKKWLLAILACFVEVCIVWTTYGVGYCLFIVVCMFFVHLFIKGRVKYAARVE